MKLMDRIKNRKGFTLIEILFAIFIGLLLLSAIYVSVISGQKSSVAIDRKVAAQQDVRSALETMTLEIGMASYNPTFASGIWRNGPTTANCGTPAGNQSIKGIQDATANSLTVEMDVGGTGSIGDENNEILRYAYDAVNRRITRETNCLVLSETDKSFIGNIQGNPRSVRVVNDLLGITNGNNVSAIFRYFDGRSPAQELFPEGNPSVIPNIRRIDITLGVETDEVDPNTQQPRRMIYSSSVVVRNHSINL